MPLEWLQFVRLLVPHLEKLMEKPTLSQRFRYWFDTTMSKGTPAVVGLLGLVSLVWVLVTGLIAMIPGLQPPDEDYDFIEATWRQLTFTLDPGTFSGDVGWQWRILSLLTTLFGVFVVASLIGVISAAFDDKVEQLRKGRSTVIESGHTVILGWNPKVFTIISELVIANESQRKPVIVVLADMDKVEMEQEIREKVADLKNTRVLCRSGNPLDQDELLRANPYAAKSIVVLGSDGDDADTYTIKTTLALTNHPRRPAGRISIVGEVRDPANLEIARLVGKDEARWVLPLETISRLTVQTCRQAGLSAVYSELLRFEGDELYVVDIPELAGLTHLEAQLRFPKAVVAGVVTTDGPLLNPEPSRSIGKGEKLIVIAEDDSLVAHGNPGTPADAVVTGLPTAEAPAERTLILGVNAQLPLMLTELDSYVAPGSHVTVVTDLDVPELPTVTNLDVRTIAADITSREVLVGLEPQSYDHILVLACRDDLEAEAADATTMITLLLLREIADSNDLDLNIVSEMIDDRNRRLAEVTRADDFIVSDNLISLMMAQVSEDPLLADLYADLFGSEGAEVYLRPAEWYVELDTPVDFYSVVAGAAKRGETAIGYRDAAPQKASAGSARVVVNPAKAESHVFHDGDMIIVLAED